jgi:muramoyltetrapeptide carboxypeptidase
MLTPNLLREGDTVAITAASGTVNAEKLSAGVKILEDMGLRVRVTESCHASHEYLAGTDALRLRDLHSSIADKKIRAIFFARGGYGAARLLPHLDYSLVKKNPKIFAGYSDITALHIAINQLCKLVTFHAPMPAADLPNADELTMSSFKENLFAGALPPHPHKLFEKSLNKNFNAKNRAHGARDFLNLKSFEGGAGETFLQKSFPCGFKGILTGGNLTIIASLLGTPYEIDTRGKVLFLEEIGEPPYRIDRLLLQLKLAGKLRDACGFILGDFSPENFKTIKLAVSELLETEGKPMIVNFPSGHCMPNVTLPLGQRVMLTELTHQFRRCDRF